uniref:Uncharacterized protein n=1 Tax=Anguilla anguilla TaxID=7936 RepID=A0A0E9SWU0_ANGAN
MSSLLWRLV